MGCVFGIGRSCGCGCAYTRVVAMFGFAHGYVCGWVSLSAYACVCLRAGVGAHVCVYVIKRE